ncbi:gp113 [Sphingomonas phage PAU]|uniref:gp113 n=1 Tax=Sphingomonas phage PAU TaxID=1150991 RepID=UPI0002573264|nr:gp113 [Sphingomonas phage PAU]AFF28111.1 gp113 [Sphingomonas phage PAU]
MEKQWIKLTFQKPYSKCFENLYLSETLGNTKIYRSLSGDMMLIMESEELYVLYISDKRSSNYRPPRKATGSELPIKIEKL